MNPRTASVPIELGELTVFPRPNREHERGAVTTFPRRAVALNDFYTFTRGITENLFDLTQRFLRNCAAVEEKLLVGAREMAGKEFPQHLLMNVLLHRAARAPAEAPADQ